MKHLTTEQKKEKKRANARKARECLSLGYVRSLLTKGTSLTAKDLPPNLVKAKQAHLLCNRTIAAVEAGDKAKLEQLNVLRQSLMGNPALTVRTTQQHLTKLHPAKRRK